MADVRCGPYGGVRTSNSCCDTRNERGILMKKQIRQLFWVFSIVSLSACGGGGGGGSAAPGAPVVVVPPIVPPPAGSATINWTAPATNIDGSPAVIAGYNLYRLTPGVTPCPIDISLYTLIPSVPPGGLATVTGSPPATTFTDTALVASTYCYGVTALNIVGQQSVPAFLANPLTVS